MPGSVVPRGTAYRGDAVQLDVVELAPGEETCVRAPASDEVVVVLLEGAITCDGRDLSRTSVFEERASAVFLPPGRQVEITARAPSELALAASVGAGLAAGDSQRVFVDPDDVVVHERGEPGWQRAVHDVVADRVAAERLIVGETFNRAGEWSSFPPHKHDGNDGEPALEEVYYFRFEGADGFGFQGLYEHDGDPKAVFLRHGTVVGIPRGYHPVAAAPGYRLYYLWAIGARPGAPRQLAMHEDPAHTWLRD